VALLAVAEALARVLADAKPLSAEDVPLAAALGRVLTEDVKALRTQPPAAVSAMDGYAVRAADRRGSCRPSLRRRSACRRNRAHLHRRLDA